MRSERRNELIRILKEGHASTQKEIVTALHAAGHQVTQATVSRDLKGIGALKLTIGDEPAYRLPDQVPRLSGGDLMARNLMRTISDFAVRIEPAGSLVVVVTAPGHAAAVARAIDMAVTDDVIGTVAGDDTIFVATPDPNAADRLARTWTQRTADRTLAQITEGSL
jgi:transcriptional regulator of arginine metabolism